jgi:uncharacterized membrane protein
MRYSHQEIFLMADEQVKNKRVMRIVLVVSLALNLAVAGLVVGSFVSGRMGNGPPRSFDLGIGSMARALNPEDRREIGAALRRARPIGDFNPRSQIELMVTALRADPFDADALRAVMSEQAQSTTQVQGAVQDVVVEHITEMSAAERAAYADRLVNELSRVRPRPQRD